MSIKTIYLCHHSHCDPGYTDLTHHVRRRHVDNLVNAVDYCQQSANRPEPERFKWIVESTYALDDYLQQVDQRQQERFVDVWRRGLIEVTGLYHSIISHHLSLEELRQSVRWTSELAATKQCPLSTAVLNDVGAATWALPEVLQEVGIKHFVLGAGGFRVLCPWADLPHLFRWVGPEGHSVLFWHIGLDRHESPQQINTLHAQYGLGNGFIKSVRQQRLQKHSKNIYHANENKQENWDSIHKLLQRLEDEQYPYDAILLQCAADNSGPDPLICDDIRYWNEHHPNGPEFRFATFTEFFQYIEKKYNAEIPSLSGDLTCTWLDQSGSLPYATSLHRRTGHLLEQYEAIARQTNNFGPTQAQQVHDVYQQMLWYSDHTYGLASWWLPKTVSTVGSPQDSLLDFHRGSWQTKANYARSAHTQAKSLMEQLETKLARTVLPQDADFVLLNPLDYERIEPIELIWPAQCDQSYQVRDLRTGQLYAADAQPISDRWSRLTFVPSIGPAQIMPYVIETNDQTPTVPVDATPIIENGIYSIQLDTETGWIKNITDMRCDRSLIDSQCQHQFGQVLHAVMDGIRDDCAYAGICSPVHRTFAKTASVTIGPTTRGRVRQTLRSQMTLDMLGQQTNVFIEVNLFFEVPNIYIRVCIDKPRIARREDVRIAFPFDIAQPTVHYRLAKGIARMNQDQLPGSGTDYLPVHDWVNVAQADYNVTLLTLDAPLVEVGGIRGEKWAGLDYIPDNGRLYAYVANNIYQTNIPQWSFDHTTFEFIITSAPKPFDATAAEKFATRAKIPPYCVKNPVGDRKL